MSNLLKVLYSIVFLIIIIPLLAGTKTANTPQNKVVLKGVRNNPKPFEALNNPALQVLNQKLNISITDKNGEMLQINGVDIEKLKNGILTPNDFTTVYISSSSGTFTDNADTNPNSLLEIKCESNKVGSPITVGLKTTVSDSKKNIRVYATLSGIIPSYTYNELH